MKRVGAALIAASVLCLCLAVLEEKPYRESEKRMDAVREKYVKEVCEEKKSDREDVYLKRAIDFEGFRRQNEDVIGWIYIPGTPVDYPILRNPYDNYYLNHDFHGQPSAAGAIFVQAQTPEAFVSRHTIVYGHHLKDGQMFGWLPQYRMPEVRAEHPKIYLYVPNRAFAVTVYSVYECPDMSETYRVSYLDGQFREWIEMTKKERMYEISAVPGEGDRIVTLSTCAAQGGNRRFVVHGILEGGDASGIREQEKTEGSAQLR